LKKIWFNAPFRVYASIADSLRDRTSFLKSNPVYTKAGLFDPVTVRDFAKEAAALKKAGYAADEEYVQKLKDVWKGRTLSVKNWRTDNRGVSSFDYQYRQSGVNCDYQRDSRAIAGFEDLGDNKVELEVLNPEGAGGKGSNPTAVYYAADNAVIFSMPVPGKCGCRSKIRCLKRSCRSADKADRATPSYSRIRRSRHGCAATPAGRCFCCNIA
jgi:hypothetical protein